MIYIEDISIEDNLSDTEKIKALIKQFSKLVEEINLALTDNGNGQTLLESAGVMTAAQKQELAKKLGVPEIDNKATFNALTVLGPTKLYPDVFYKIKNLHASWDHIGGGVSYIGRFCFVHLAFEAHNLSAQYQRKLCEGMPLPYYGAAALSAVVVGSSDVITDIKTIVSVDKNGGLNLYTEEAAPYAKVYISGAYIIKGD